MTWELTWFMFWLLDFLWFILQEAGIDARFSEIGASIQETIEPVASGGRWDNRKTHQTIGRWRMLDVHIVKRVFLLGTCLFKQLFYLDQSMNWLLVETFIQVTPSWVVVAVSRILTAWGPMKSSSMGRFDFACWRCSKHSKPVDRRCCNK